VSSVVFSCQFYARSQLSRVVVGRAVVSVASLVLYMCSSIVLCCVCCSHGRCATVGAAGPVDVDLTW